MKVEVNPMMLEIEIGDLIAHYNTSNPLPGNRESFMKRYPELYRLYLGMRARTRARTRRAAGP